MHTEPDNNASGDTPSSGTLAARDREIVPPLPPLPLHSGDPLRLEELRRAYEVYNGTPSHNLVGALRAHFQDVRTDRPFAAALLPHGATNICVQQLQGAPHPRTKYHRGPNRRLDLVDQPPPARSGADMGPAPRLGKNAHCPMDRTRACTEPRRPDVSRAATEHRRPQHPTVQWLRRLGKHDSPREEAQPPGDDAAIGADRGAGGKRGASGARHPQHRRHGGSGKRPLIL